MIIIQMGFCWPSFAKTCMYKEYKEYPIFAFHFFLFRIYFIYGSSHQLFYKTIQGLCNDKEYLIKNADKLRLEIKKAKAKAKAQAKRSLQTEVDYYFIRAKTAEKESNKYQKEAHTLKKAFELLTKDDIE